MYPAVGVQAQMDPAELGLEHFRDAETVTQTERHEWRKAKVEVAPEDRPATFSPRGDGRRVVVGQRLEVESPRTRIRPGSRGQCQVIHTEPAVHAQERLARRHRLEGAAEGRFERQERERVGRPRRRDRMGRLATVRLAFEDTRVETRVDDPGIGRKDGQDPPAGRRVGGVARTRARFRLRPSGDLDEPLELPRNSRSMVLRRASRAKSAITRP